MIGEVATTQAFGAVGNLSLGLIGVGGIIVVVILYFIVTYNSIINAKNSVDESFSAIDTVLQNRYDLIPNLVQIVKQYAAHESQIFENVTKARSGLMNRSGDATATRFAEENALTMGVRGIFAVAENYPDLKASNNFLELQTQWGEMEDRLQGARRAYNASVKELRNKREMFPSNIVASMMTIKAYEMFEAETVARTAPSAKDLFA